MRHWTKYQQSKGREHPIVKYFTVEQKEGTVFWNIGISLVPDSYKGSRQQQEGRTQVNGYTIDEDGNINYVSDARTNCAFICAYPHTEITETEWNEERIRRISHDVD